MESRSALRIAPDVMDIYSKTLASTSTAAVLIAKITSQGILLDFVIILR